MKLPSPRDYQARGIELLRQSIRDGYKKILFFLATGGGKSVIFICIIAALLTNKKKVCLVVRRKQLVMQTRRHFDKCEIDSSVMLNNQKGFDPNKNFQICSIDTVTRRETTFLKDFDYVIIDEAHDATSDTYKEFLNSFSEKTIFIGLTATPFQIGKKVHDFFQCVVKPIEVHELRDRGFLTDADVFVPMEIDLSNVKTDSYGDYSKTELSKKMQDMNIVGDIVENYKKYGNNHPAICFCVDKNHSQLMTEQFNSVGIPAIHCDESTQQKERDHAIESLKNGTVKVLCNVNIFSTGVDIPEAIVGLMARPTKSEVLYIQQCLDSETEILTKNGFKKNGQISNGDIVASINLKNNNFEYVEAENVFSRKINENENFYGIKSSHLDIRVTGGHDILVNSNNLDKNKYTKQSAIEVSKKNGMFRIPVSCKTEKERNKELSNDELIFIGIYLSDGCINKKTNSLQIGQSEKYIDRCNEIEEIIKKCNFRYGKGSIKRTGKFSHCPSAIVFSISKGMPRKKIDYGKTGYERIEKWLDKKFPIDLFSTLNREQFSYLLHGINIGDGAKNDYVDVKRITKTIAMGTNIEFTENLQHLCVVNGFRCNKSEYVGPSKKTWYTLHIKDITRSSIAGANTRNGSFKDKKEYKRSRFTILEKSIDEVVWCLQNKNGTLVTRRNGKIAIIGNCGRLLRPYRKCGRCKTQYDNSTACPICGFEKPDFIKLKSIIVDFGNNTAKHGLPFDVRYAVITKQDKDQDKKEKPLVKTCRNCFRIYPASYPKCPNCDGAETKERFYKTKSGELRLYNEYESVKATFLYLCRIELETMKKPNWKFFQLYTQHKDICMKYADDFGIPKWIPKIWAKSQEEKSGKLYN